MTAGAWARASASAFPAPGEKFLHSASFVNEAGPLDDPPKAMEAVSTARVVTQWVVTTDGSFASTSAPVAATLGFDGYLFGANGLNWLATVEATMNVYLDGVMSTVFQGAGQYARHFHFKRPDPDDERRIPRRIPNLATGWGSGQRRLARLRPIVR